MEKTSKVIRVESSHTFSTENGKFYVSDVEFENGDKGQYNSKSNDQTNFKQGVEATYTIEPNGSYPSRIKLPKKEFTGNPGGGKSYGRDPLTQQLIIAQSSCDKAITIISEGKIGKPDREPYTIADLKPLTGRIMTIVNELAAEHNAKEYRP